MKYKHIIFDIDGTMLDSAQADLGGLQQVIRELQGKEIEISKLHFALGIPGEIALKQLGIENVKEANILWNNYMQELAYTMQLFDGIHELITKLKNKEIKLGIITSKNRREYHNDFVPFGLDSYFDTVICVEDSITPKPSPAPMFSYLEKTGARKEETIYIGDTLYDWKCADGAGVDFGLALWGCHSAEHIHPTYYLKTPTDILSFD